MDQEVQEELWSEADNAVLEGEDLPEPERELGTITVPLNVIKVISAAPSGEKILQTCIDLAVFLSTKNAAYGNSALSPIRAFSKAGTTEQLLVRIDDKINRMVNGSGFPGDDDILDLTGYLILYFVAKENDGTSIEE